MPQTAPRVFAILSLYATDVKGKRVLLQKVRVDVTSSLVMLYAPPDEMGAASVQQKIEVLEHGTPYDQRQAARALVWADPENMALAPVGALMTALKGMSVPAAMYAQIDVEDLKAWKKANYPQSA